MSGNSCSYDCSVTSDVIPSYTDISGIGVIVSYVVTAFFVVVTTSSYYLFTYQPDLDPFRKDGAPGDETLSRYQSNPIDKIFLSWLAKWLPRRPEQGNGQHSRLEKALIKCVLNMSDLQIVTGLSILISGFTQLGCGLSAYHWQVLVYLAWFSSLTHLCCLTFLRNYLFTHPGQRLWRLVSMFIIIVMLVVALVPTGNFDWLHPSNSAGMVTPTPPPGSYAICFFKEKPPKISDYGKQIAPNSYLSMIISSLLLLLGFFTRVIRLHKTLSVDYTQRLRYFLSETARSGLRRVYYWCRVEVHPQTLKRSLIYHPLLAGFLILRVSLDVYSSMLMEVWWLFVGFTWGMIHLVSTLKLSPVDDSNGDWSFGQVVQIVLLAAPAIAVVEFFYEDTEPERHVNAAIATSIPSTTLMKTAFNIAIQEISNPSSSTDQIANIQNLTQNHNTPSIPSLQTLPITGNPFNSPTTALHDSPDFDFYNHAPWFKWIILYTLSSVSAISICIIVYTALGTPMALFVFYPIPWLWWKWSVFGIPLTFFCFILFVILLEDVRLQGPQSLSRDRLWTLLNGALSGYFLFQLVVFKVSLPMEATSVADVWLSWITVVVPPEVYLFVVGHRDKTVYGFLWSLFFGVLLMASMFFPLLAALAHQK